MDEVMKAWCGIYRVCYVLSLSVSVVLVVARSAEGAKE